MSFLQQHGFYPLAVYRLTRALFAWSLSQRRRALKGGTAARQEQPGFPFLETSKEVVNE
jgi:hypothetical protein